MEIVRVTAANMSLLDKVNDDVFDAEIDKGRLAAFVARQGHALFVAVGEGEVIGQIACIVHLRPDLPNEMYIDNLGVAEEWRRKGIARRLLDEVVELARAEGCVTVWVATEPDNVAANALYGERTEVEPCVVFAWDV